MKKRIFALLLAAALLCALLPTAVFAADTVSGKYGDLTWKLDGDGVLTVSGIGDMENTMATSYPWYAYSDRITAVVIEAGVTSIGGGAFSYVYDKLTRVSLPEGLTDIGYESFSCCTALTELALPQSVERIDDYAFDGCTALTQLTLPERLTSIGEGAFELCGALTSVTLNEGLTEIGWGAFAECTALTEITIPKTVTAVGDAAFAGTSSLRAIRVAAGNPTYLADEVGVLYSKDKTELIAAPGALQGAYTIPSGVEKLHPYAFFGCAALTDVTVPASVTSIGDMAFSYCNELRGIWVAEENTHYSSDASGVLFNKDKTTLLRCPGGESGTYNVPDGVLHITYQAFSGCEKLTSVTLPASLESIGAEVFYNCTSLTGVYFCGNAPKCLASNSLFLYFYPDTGSDVALPNLKVYYVEGTERWDDKNWWKEDCELTPWDGVVPPAHIHSYTLTVTAPTCLQQGFTTHACSCGDSYKDTYVSALGHDMIKDAAVPATCTKDGLTEGSHCSRCDAAVKQTVVPKLGHDMIKDAAVPATCTKDGLTEGSHCSRCDVAVKQTVVPKLGHEYKNGVCTRCGAADSGSKPSDPDKLPKYSDFIDLLPNGWYKPGVTYALEHGLMNGVGNKKFDPDGVLTRAMLVTILYRNENSPSVAGKTNRFKDVPAGQWYTNAIIWAADQGIVKGMSETTFEPDTAITREQIATILFRSSKSAAVKQELSAFPDASKISSYALDAMRWAVAKELINGKDGLLAPQENATRAQVATILMRYWQGAAEK